MGTFDYGKPLKRSLRKGVFLRIRHLPLTLVNEARQYMHKGEVIDLVIVSEIKKAPKVLLEFWCRVLGDYPVEGSTVRRYNVFHLCVDENADWSCESDTGRGYK